MTEPSRTSETTRTTCPYCGVGCGILATRQDDGSVSVTGDPDHPANFGRLCSKGSALAETLGPDGRLLHPVVRGRRTGWNTALDAVAEGFARAVRDHGPDSVAFYVSGQLLTEDYYAANKLMKGYIGSANIDTNSRLCMASSVAGHCRAFGSDTVPGIYEDLECADLIVLTGSNLAWCHPVLYQRIAAAKTARPEMKVVLIDPRRTMTADLTDLHLPIKPDGDVALFLGLLAHLEAAGAIDGAYTDRHVNALGNALGIARSVRPDELLEQTGLSHEQLMLFYWLFTETERAVTVYSQGVNQSAVGSDKVNAIINCHLATGRIGRPGMGPFSVTGQPNAMGGREVGGLANMLAAHMAIENPDHRAIVQDFWQSPAMASRPGLKAVDMFRAVADGRIKALWIMATNPVDTLPDGDLVEAAIKACPFVVVSDVLETTDTVRHAHVKLPAAAWGEKDGTVTNSERRISRQKSFMPLPGDARPDWWIVSEVAKRMGFTEAFAWSSPAGIYREHAGLSGFRNVGSRDFDISASAAVTDDAYDELEPFLWPATDTETSLKGGRFFADGGFFTEDGKANAIPVRLPRLRKPAAGPGELTLNTGRVRDHWHTMTRTAGSPRLSAHMAEPYAELHPDDARHIGIDDASIVRVAGNGKSILVRALITARQQRGAVFVPMHWNDQFSGSARVGRLIPSITDPLSGQPASKNVQVRVEPFPAALYGFAVTHDRPCPDACDYWATARTGSGWRTEFAAASMPADSLAFAGTLAGAPAGTQPISYFDRNRGQTRIAWFEGDRLSAAVFLANAPVAVSRATAVAALDQEYGDMRSRFHVIAGRPGGDVVDPGAIVCSCFSVGINQIVETLRAGKAATVEDIGACLSAGTNCGSCRSEIREIIDANRLVAAE